MVEERVKGKVVVCPDAQLMVLYIHFSSLLIYPVRT